MRIEDSPSDTPFQLLLDSALLKGWSSGGSPGVGSSTRHDSNQVPAQKLPEISIEVRQAPGAECSSKKSSTKVSLLPVVVWFGFTAPCSCGKPSKVYEYLILCLHDGTRTSSSVASTTCSERVEAQTGSADHQTNAIRLA